LTAPDPSAVGSADDPAGNDGNDHLLNGVGGWLAVGVRNGGNFRQGVTSTRATTPWQQGDGACTAGQKAASRSDRFRRTKLCLPSSSAGTHRDAIYAGAVTQFEVTGAGSVEVDVGDEIVIQLPENATTGYLWSVREMGDGLDLVEDTTIPATARQGVGAGGVRVIRVRAVAPTRGDLVLQLRRAWEDRPIEERRVTVIARGPGRTTETAANPSR
jgi:inhibitor of cysteine peptidase